MSVSLKEHTKRLTIVSLVIIVHYTKCHNVCVSEWRTGNIISLNCSVCSLVHDVSIYDPSSYPPNRTSKFFATCLADSQDKGTRKCNNQNATQDFTTHTTSFVIGDVATFNLYGIWTCRHGSDEGYLELKPFESRYSCIGDQPKFIGGSISRKNKISTFTFSCHTCRRPIKNCIFFLVDEVIENVIRAIGEECFNNQELCIDEECSCSSTKNTYQWVYRTNKPIHVFGVQLGLIDAHNGSIVKVHLQMTYNGKEFIAQESHTETIKLGSEDFLSDAKNEKGMLSLYASIGLPVSLLAFFFLLYCYKRRPRRYSRVTADEGEEMVGLLNNSGSTTTENECCKCEMLSVCAVCDTCQDFYCETCCNAHTKTSPSHNVCLIDHVVKSGFDVKCRKCEREEPAFVCKQCKTILCNDCKCEYCSPSGRISLATSKGNKLVRRVSEGFSSVLSLKYDIDLPNNDLKNNRVCGLCFLNDETIVVSDINNKKIHIIKNNRQNTEIKFFDEPRGMAHMFGNQIAITFAYKEEIKILEIKDHDEQEKQSLSLKKIGKPYSIAYNGDHFAVEIGESEDGFIAILDSYGNLKHRISNKHREFAYFTGNTIRLALDMTKGRIFIAALSKNTVTCTDFEGRTMWKVSIPSPRGIIFLPGIPELKNLILANKRHDTVYQMSSKDGSTDVLISEGIEGPRYMAYNLHTKLLCVQIGNNKLMVYHYDIK